MLADFRARQRDYLLEISRAITQELDLDKLLGRILNISIEMLAGQAGLIALRGESGDWKIPLTHNIPQAFIKYLQPFLADIPADPQESSSNELPQINRLLVQLTQMASLGLMTGVGLPLIARQKVVGVIFIFRS